MDWEEMAILGKYPRSYKILKQHICSNYLDCLDVFYHEGELYISTVTGSYPYCEKKLFDFFDEQGLRIFITPNKDFAWMIVMDDKLADLADKAFSTRTEAEEQAFTKAFQLLEEKLNRGKK